MNDPRDQLTDNKLFIHFPLPLFFHLCKLRLETSDWKVFLLHWHAGMMGDQEQRWKSKIPLKSVADKTGLSLSTVKRSYDRLTDLGFIRRQDCGRNPLNPMRQNVSETEVTIPQDVVIELLEHSTDRYKGSKAPLSKEGRPEQLSGSHYSSAAEALELTPEKRTSKEFISPNAARKVFAGAANKLKQQLKSLIPDDEEILHKTWQEILWSIETEVEEESDESIIKKKFAKVRTVALNLVKSGNWNRPMGMPEDWQW